MASGLFLFLVVELAQVGEPSTYFRNLMPSTLTCFSNFEVMTCRVANKVRTFTKATRNSLDSENELDDIGIP
jgi:hypothetical protein